MGVWIAVLSFAVVGCGSTSVKSAPGMVPGGAEASTPASSPAYCKALTSSKPLLASGAAMNLLAENSGNGLAKATLRRAATAILDASGKAPHRQRIALVSAAKGVHALAVHGLAQASRARRALVHVGHLLQKSCAFPVG
jgi:hypothetical protein